jgi:DNA processing protein
MGVCKVRILAYARVQIAILAKILCLSTLFCMKINKIAYSTSGYPDILNHLADPPKQLFVMGTPLETGLRFPAVGIVGSRKASSYGLAATRRLTYDLAGQGIGIISGLAIGVDGAAHAAALDAGGYTIAVLAGGLDRIYPARHRQLAERILASGGTIISEYPEGTESYKINFVARNRIIAGLAQGVLLTEAASKSGSLHTADFALEQGKTVMAVPGPITVDTSAGTNALIRNGAALVTSAKDVLQELGIETMVRTAGRAQGRTETEQKILSLLDHGVTSTAELLVASSIDTSAFNQTLTMLELEGIIHPLGAGQWGRAK